MKISTQEIRKAIKEAGLRHWQVAKMAGCGEATLVRWLRDDPMPEERCERVMMAIESAKAKKWA